MLTEICDFIHNYFEYEVQEGTFTVSGGAIAVDFLKHGQRFRIKGSAVNDGIYTYTESGILDDDSDQSVTLTDETFTGTITAMAVPRDVIAICAEIRDWQTANSNAVNSPYTSESFGGYSYTKATGTSENGASRPFTWRDMFGARLNAYRKIA